MAKAKSNTKLSFLIMLGLPSLGLTFAVTTLSAYLPSILKALTNPLIIGLIIGAEGFFGLFLPVIFGSLADRAKNIGGRLGYLIPAVAAMTAGLIFMGLIHNLFVIGFMVALFYLGYYAYLAPYWALYPDLIPDSHSGRSRSAESTWRGAGAILALIGSGFLISLWQPLPFLVAAGLIVAVSILLKPVLGKRVSQPLKPRQRSIKQSFGEAYRTLKSNSKIRDLVIANSLWNAALRSILAFTVLFFSIGLNKSHSFVSGFIFPVAGVGIAIMVPLAGKLADRFSHTKVLTIAALIYGLGDLVPVFTQQAWVVLIIPIVSAAAATIMVLPYSVLMRLLNGEAHGSASGIFGLSRGVGSFIGPLLTGLAVFLAKSLFSFTKGYAAFWLATGAYVLISLFFVRRLGAV